MPHELVIFPNGTASLKPEGTGEPMHSSIGAWTEAQALYVGQSRLAQCLCQDQSGESGPLVLYDIGMGTAANALAAMQCALDLPAATRRKLQIVSFESDLDGLRTALRHASHFPFYAGFESALHAIAEKGRWEATDAGVSWELREGDFLRQALGDPEPEIIFFDFYSPKSSESALWGYETFARLHAACRTRLKQGRSTVLLTYSSATAVRAAMLLAGFFVGTGEATQAKRETTMASTRREDLLHPLDQEWLAKFLRSDKPLPADWPQERAEEARRAIRDHAQFN